jgi:mycofactocin precursor peptide peptidase
VATAELPPLALARWPQVDRSARRVLLWPVGSTEQHGPHLPMGTDTVVAQALAAAAHEAFPDTGLAPALPIGASGEHAGFPGTLSIGTEALTQVVVEFVRHASRHWAHVVVVNGHGGNLPALRAAAATLEYEKRSLVVHSAAPTDPRADAHAGFVETSLLLHLAAGAVRTDLAAPGATGPLAELMPAMRRDGVRAVSPNGVLGDPTGADAGTGHALFQQMLGPLLETVRTLLGTPT